MTSHHTAQSKVTKTAQPSTQAPAAQTPSTQPHPMSHLQRQVGNQATAQIIQAKLTVGEPNDMYEQEADRVAAEVAPTAPLEGERPNQTGLPDRLKAGIENLSGYSMDDVRVHYNSDKPSQLQAHAYTQGTNIYVATGQERYLPHEAWHVVQQAQGRVVPTIQNKDRLPVNDDEGLEREADAMGARATQNRARIADAPPHHRALPKTSVAQAVLSLGKGKSNEYTRVNGGTIAASEEREFEGGPSDIENAEPGNNNGVAFVPNVPTTNAAKDVAVRYMEGWKDKEDARKRQRLVIGVNTWQSLGENLDSAMDRARVEAAEPFPDGAKGTVLIFVWRPNWSRGNLQKPSWPSTSLTLPLNIQDQEKLDALNKDKIPYGLIRSHILSSAATARYAAAFKDKGYEPYVHIADPDAPSFKVPKGRQKPGGEKEYMSESFAEESTEGLFDRLTALIKRRIRTREGRTPKEMPTVVSGGYQLRPSSNTNKQIPLSAIASQIDMQVRRVLYSKGTSATTVYLPEPNLLVRWENLPKGTDSKAQDSLLVGKKGESQNLMEKLVAALKDKNISDDQIRMRIAFKPAAAIATGAIGQGKRFLAATEQEGGKATKELSLKEAYESVLKSEQNHANPAKLPRFAVDMLQLGTAQEKTTLEKRARHHMITAAEGSVLSDVLESEKSKGTAAERPESLSEEDDGKLEILVKETVKTILAYNDKLKEIIKPDL